MIAHPVRIALVLLISTITAISSSASFAQQSGMQTLYPPIPWKIMPGEDIAETARLVYPKDAVAREHLVRAIVGINPAHFPQGAPRLLVPGTIIQFPDLRTIGSYAGKKKSAQIGKKEDNSARHQQATQVKDTTNRLTEDHSKLLPFIAQLEKTAVDEAQELAVLRQHIAVLEILFNAIQSAAAAGMAVNHESAAVELPPDTPEEASISPDLVEGSQSVPANHQEEAIVSNQELQNAVTRNEPALLSEPQLEPESDNTSLIDQNLLLAILVLLLIAYAWVRHRQSGKEFMVSSSKLSLDEDERAQYQSLLLRQKTINQEPSMAAADTASEVMKEINTLIEQNNNDAAIELLQKQLASQPQDISAWLQLFELLYKTNNKGGFKKNARRFKRMKSFPDIWHQIQALGNRLEPNEPLYFDEQKRKEKFFPESAT